MAKYKTTKAMSKKGGIIRTGGTISLKHPRFDEGIRKGWIVLDGKKAKSKKPLPVSSKETETPKVTEGIPTLNEPETKLENVVEEILDTHESGDPGLETAPIVIHPSPDESKSPSEEATDSDLNSITIDELDFLNQHDESVLLEKSILQVSDLKGWDVERLMVLRGIGSSKATQLLDAYDEWEKSQITE